MEWFEGGVGEAIAAAKAKKAIFTVFIKGSPDDEGTTQMMSTLSDPDVVSGFSSMVCISVENGSTTCMQFSSIYPVILVPCVYFIDSSTGVDLEITGGAITKDVLLASINKAVERVNTQTVTVTQQAAANDVSREQSSSVTESLGTSNDVEVYRPEPPANTEGQTVSLEERVEKAKQLMAQRQHEREEQEKEKEKEKEIERREIGKALLERKRLQEEQELKEAAVARKKDKEEEKKAKEAVRAAIEQDRLDRKMKFDAEKKARDEERKEKEKVALAERAALAEKTASERATIARIQFRLPDGSSQTQQFPAEAPLSALYDFVSTGLETKFSSFSLSTTFPRRMLDQENKTTPLKDLQMAPSATVLVLPLGGIVSHQDGGIMSLIWMILAPFTFLWTMLLSFFGSTSASNPQQNPLQSSERIQRHGGIGRLHNNDDDLGENNTWNGNSTQQQ